MKLRSVHSLLLMFLFGIILTVSCKKDIKNESVPESPGNPFPVPAASPVNGSVSGLIVDENNTPVEGAVAKLGALSATTNAKGIFSFDNATLDKYITTVTVEMPGYFKAYRSFSANATKNYISIKLLPKTTAGTVNSTAGGTVSLSNGTQLSFQPGSLVIKSTGAAYSGNVKVFATYIDPTAADISSIVPGSFMGRDGNNLYTLQSTGMIAVDLESDNGEALQLAGNLPATIKMPIPASLLSKAPTSIDTWSLDEQGVWKKEGTAPRTGDFYEMQVTHFSFWNCDAPCNAIYLTLHVQDQNGNSLSNTLVQLTVPNSASLWPVTYGSTDSLGNVSGLVPAAVDIQMNIFSNQYSCSAPVSTQTIGPFSTSTSLAVTATISAAQLLTIAGTAVDCSSSPIQNGTAFIYAGPYNHYSTTITNGNYSINVTNCGNIDTVNVTVIDYSNGAQGNSGVVTVSGNTVTVPAITACGGNVPAAFTFGNTQGNCAVSVVGGTTFNQGVPISPNTLISMPVVVTSPGSYSISTAIVNGFSFSGTGTFNDIGQQYIYLTASGTPIAGGNTDFTCQSGALTGCPFTIHVYNPAVIDQNTCSDIIVSGTYTVDVPFGSSNIVTMTLNVITPGDYTLQAGSSDGTGFISTGTVTATGPQTFTFYGNGVSPAFAGPSAYVLDGPGTGCQFNIDISPAPTVIGYMSFDGQPDACTAATVTGAFTVATIIPNYQYTVEVLVDAISTGGYSASTATVNGISFNGGGDFGLTGPHTITLYASGTPISAGTFTFTLADDNQPGVTGCSFTITVN